jgi:hypothetical protein
VVRPTTSCALAPHRAYRVGCRRQHEPVNSAGAVSWQLTKHTTRQPASRLCEPSSQVILDQRDLLPLPLPLLLIFFTACSSGCGACMTHSATAALASSPCQAHSWRPRALAVMASLLASPTRSSSNLAPKHSRRISASSATLR